MGDILMVIALIPFFLAGYYVMGHLRYYIRENNKRKHSIMKKGTVHDLRSESGK